MVSTLDFGWLVYPVDSFFWLVYLLIDTELSPSQNWVYLVGRFVDLIGPHSRYHTIGNYVHTCFLESLPVNIEFMNSIWFNIFFPISSHFIPFKFERPLKQAAGQPRKVWNGGQGGQCPMMPTVQGFGLCKTHADRHAAEGLAHGRVDGPIPLAPPRWNTENTCHGVCKYLVVHRYICTFFGGGKW